MQEKEEKKETESEHYKCCISEKILPFHNPGEIREKVCIPASEFPLRKFEGRHYCLFHYPSKDKGVGGLEKFQEVFKKRLSDVDRRCEEIEKDFPNDEEKQLEIKHERKIIYDFRYVWFPQEFSLTDETFSAYASFSSATFSADAYFRSATFSEDTYFAETKFSKDDLTIFVKTNFEKDVFFDSSEFGKKVSFNSANFGEESDVFFRKTKFDGDADFQYCTADGYLRFKQLHLTAHSKFDFQNAAFEKASRIEFHTCRLRPNWFVNIDPRKFVLTDIDWQNIDRKYKNQNIQAELEQLSGIENSDRLLQIACRQLAVNAEENNRYEEASKFRYLAMETRRLENNGIRRFVNLHWFYKLSSGYGESWSQAAILLLGVLIFFGVVYATPLARFDYGEEHKSMELFSGLVHSLYVAALQRPEPKAYDTLTKAFIILETIFAPLQAALLALAIRRKFMR